MRKARLGLTVVALLAAALMIACDIYRNSVYTMDFICNTFIGYGLGFAVAYMWPWNERARDSKGRFIRG